MRSVVRVDMVHSDFLLKYLYTIFPSDDYPKKQPFINTISTSERLLLFRVRTAVSGRDRFENFRSGSGFWHICHVDRPGQFTLKQLRLSLVNEMHTDSYTSP